MTGLIHIDLFTTLDGVAQAPGGPEEDTTDGFTWGGWQAPFDDDVAGGWVMEGMTEMDALILGRRTYDIFAGYWPRHTTGPEGPIGQLFDRIPKYVASRSDIPLDWQGSSLLGDDLGAAIADIRDRHENAHVIGSVDLAHTLIAEELYDVLNLWVYPIVLGTGKKVFPEGSAPRQLRSLAPAETSPSGILRLRYAPAGVPTTGDMSNEPPAA